LCKTAARQHDDCVAHRQLLKTQSSELRIVHAAICSIDYDPRAVGDLIDDANLNDPADQRCLTGSTFEQRHGHCRARDSRLLETGVDDVELVGTLPQLPQLRLQAGIELPDPARALPREAEALQRL